MTELLRITENEVEALFKLQLAYKLEIGEAAPTEADAAALSEAIKRGEILFFACSNGDALIGCCSVSPTFSTFDYKRSGVFEDFYVIPEFRHRGIARRLVRFAFEQSGVSTLTVGCADCDVKMYEALGFRTRLGNMLAFDS